MSCEDCLNRRSFLAVAAGTAAATALAACGDGQLSGVTDRITGVVGPATLDVKVGDHPALATDNQLVRIVGTFVAVKRTSPGVFVAYSMQCTHAGCLTNIENNAFVCPCHGSRFDINGMVTQTPATASLATFTTSYDAATDILTVG